MIKRYAKELAEELKLSLREDKGKERYFLEFLEDTMTLWDLKPGLFVTARITSVPAQRKEELFTYLMRANLLGQGTGETRLGIDAEEKFLTLSLALPYEMDYPQFREKVEDFVNYLRYYREEILQKIQEENLY